MPSELWSATPPSEDCVLWMRVTHEDRDGTLIDRDVVGRWHPKLGFGYAGDRRVYADGMKKFGPRIPSPEELASLHKQKERADKLYRDLYPDDLPVMTPRHCREEEFIASIIEAAGVSYSHRMTNSELVAAIVQKRESGSEALQRVLAKLASAESRVRELEGKP